MNIQTKQTWPALIRRAAVGALISILAMLAICMIAAAIISANGAESNLGYGAAAAVIGGTLSGALWAGWRLEQKRTALLLIHGCFCFALLLLLGGIIFESGPEGIGPTGAACIGSSLAAGLFGKKGKPEAQWRKKRWKTRLLVQSAQMGK